MYSDAELPLLTRITAYLAENCHRHVTLDELSRELHVSGSTIRQTFRKKMNVSIGHYQLVQRIIRAYEAYEKKEQEKRATSAEKYRAQRRGGTENKKI